MTNTKMMKKVKNVLQEMRCLKKDIRQDMRNKSKRFSVRLANHYATSATWLLEAPLLNKTTLSEVIKTKTGYDISMKTVLFNASIASHLGTLNSMKETSNWFFANPTAKAKFRRMKHNHEQFDYEKDDENVDIVDVNSITLPSALKIIQSYLDKLFDFVKMEHKY